MNWLDITILCLVGLGLIKGLFDGMIKQVVSLAALIIGIYLCANVSEWLSGYLEQLDWFPEHVVKIASYVLGFILIAAFVILIGHVLSRVVNATPLGLFNHLIGGVLGALLMVIFISFILNVISIADKKSTIISNEVKVESKFYQQALDFIPSLFPGDIFKSWIPNGGTEEKTEGTGENPE